MAGRERQKRKKIMAYRKIIIPHFGGPEVLQVEEVQDLPEPRRGEVRVKVLAASASFTDTLVRKGKYPGVKGKLPLTPGYDLVGIVDKLGPGTGAGIQIGKKVAALTRTGAYTEYICLPAEQLVPVPDELDPVEAAGMVLSYITAYQMLHRSARVSEGVSILIHGAGGAVGTALLQLGSLMDLKMYGTASASKKELVERLVGIHIDYGSEDFVQRIAELEPGGVDAVFDAIGGDHFKRSLSCLAPGGKLVAYGFYNSGMGKGSSPAADIFRLLWWRIVPNRRRASFYAIGTGTKKKLEEFRKDLSELFNLLKDEKIKPVIEQRLPLEKASEAHRLIDDAAVKGKIVLVP